MQGGDKQGAQQILRILEAVNSTVELRQVLFRLVDITVELTGADRSMLFLREGSKLVPTAVAGAPPKTDILDYFRRQEPIDLDEAGRGRALLETDLVVIEDTSRSPLVPAQWVEAFGPQWVAVVPLVNGDHVEGILTIDNPPPYQLSDQGREQLRTVAQIAQIAIRGAATREQLARKTETMRKLLSGTVGLAASVEPEEALAAIQRCVTSIFGNASCSISLDEKGETGVPLPGSGQRIVLPLRTGGDLHGHLILETEGAVGAEEIELLEAFASQAALAIERGKLLSRLRAHVHQLKAAYRLSEAVPAPANLGRILREIEDEVARESGFVCVEVAFRRSRLVSLLRCRQLSREEVLLAARLMEGKVTRVEQVDADGLYAAAVAMSGRAAGVLFVRPTGARPLTAEQRDMVRALATRIGEVAHRARLQHALREAEHKLEVGNMRRQIADRVSATVGRTLRLLWDELISSGDGTSEHLKIAEMKQLVSQGLMEVHATAESLAVLGVRRDGLVRALGSLLSSFQDVTGTAATLRIGGDPVQLRLEIEEAVFEIVFNALWAVERTSRASTVVVHLNYEDGVHIVVRDDGEGLAQRGRDEPGAGVHYGVGTIRHRVEELGGSVEVKAVEPRGVRIDARIPKDGAGPAPLERSRRMRRVERGSAALPSESERGEGDEMGFAGRT